MDNLIPAVIFELENNCSTAHLSASSFPLGPACRRALGTSMPCANRLGCHAHLKAWPFRPGRSHAATSPPRSVSPPSSPVSAECHRSRSSTPCHRISKRPSPRRRSLPSSLPSTRGSPVHRSASTPSAPLPSRHRQ
jgi:hypothetical protein